MFAAVLQQELKGYGYDSTVMSRPPEQAAEALEIVCGGMVTMRKRIWLEFIGSKVKLRLSGNTSHYHFDLIEPDSVEKIIAKVKYFHKLADYIDG